MGSGNKKKVSVELSEDIVIIAKIGELINDLFKGGAFNIETVKFLLSRIEHYPYLGSVLGVGLTIISLTQSCNDMSVIGRIKKRYDVLLQLDSNSFVKPDFYKKTVKELCDDIQADIEYYRKDFMFKGIFKGVIAVLAGYVSYVVRTVALMLGMGFIIDEYFPRLHPQMSCGQNRRRPKRSSTYRSKLDESSSNNTRSSSKTTRSPYSKRNSSSKTSLKQISQKNPSDFDRFRIVDENGNDVTPRRIADDVQIKIQKKYEEETIGNKRNTDNQERSVSETSVVANTNSTSRKLPTETAFSTGERIALDIGTRILLESEHLLTKTYSNRTSCIGVDNQITQATFQFGIDLQRTDSTTDCIVLNETETIFILNLTSSVITPSDNETEYRRTNEKNQAYLELCKTKHGNDLYIERSMQTFNNLSKQAYVNTDALFIRSQQSWANPWDLHESLTEAKKYEGKIYRQYAADNNKVIVDGYSKSNIQKTIASTKSSQISSALSSQDSSVKMTMLKANCFALDPKEENPLPDLDIQPFIMERILNLNVFHEKQAVYQGLHGANNINRESRLSTIANDDTIYLHRKQNLSFMKSTNVTIERLWNYASPLTHGRNVSCLCWNERNHNILAVGYGKLQYNDEKEGLVCCWSLKNFEFPERYYQTDAGVTSLSFSLKRPNLLAVGLFDGNICVFDLNENHTSAIVDTSGYIHKHISPVWQITWNEQIRSSKTDNMEVLVSISSDGRVMQWTLRKEFEAMDLMHLKRYASSQQTSENKIGMYDNASFVGGFCFDIRSNDKTIYLCGTDDGFVHCCSTLYNEKYLESYIGHIGAVYKVHWSPFAENIFLTASADWTIRLWMTGHAEACMVFSSANSKMFLDAIWSPKSSTMFCCISENTIEIWDLSESILDPIYVASCPEQLALTSIIYATDSDCILVGTSDGSVWIYHIKNLSSNANANDLLTIVEQHTHNRLGFLT
ncbi:unnamed protein product [Adineta ricciae]|uniref:Dynein axonemal intermediate chain 4 n=1 Tax=Adineta ricciae TaxID=249248 RepID=A0A814JIW2_ADIRI|nr:unnamed protein product [Adineta ricciae]CAF1038653.1 unnamed protein product [Adineta ricciae]